MILDRAHLSAAIKKWGMELGFQQVGISLARLDKDKQHLLNWLAHGMHGEMSYMARHIAERTRPTQLVPGTISIISVRMDYFPATARHPDQILNDPNLAYISRYALGRDYHKLIRRRLQRLCNKIEDAIGTFGYRCFTDSAPVLEKALARNGGLGWIGKHSNLINPQAGSWFFLGEIYTDLVLPVDPEFNQHHCGTCTACIDRCPTEAIIGPGQIDARRCVSYLTIEFSGVIPVALRKKIGNRIYGCDDCQLVCPWNRFSQSTAEQDFEVRHRLDQAPLLTLFAWTEKEFYENTAGSAIRRIGYARWQRNIAIALGNAPRSAIIVDALKQRLATAPNMVRVHILWALKQHQDKHPLPLPNKL